MHERFARFWMRVWLWRAAFVFLGMIAAVPLVAPWSWPLALIGFAPLAYAALFVERARGALVLGWYFGAGYMGVAWSWIFSMLPFAWLGVENDAAGTIAATIVWLILSITLGWVPGAWAYALSRMRERPLYTVLGVSAILLPLLEWVRACAFSILAWSPGMGLNADFSLGAVGYGLSWSPGLLWVAALGGVSALSIVAALSSVLLAFAARTSGARRMLLYSAPTALIVIGFVAPPAAIVEIGERYVEINGISVALLQEELAPTLLWDGERAEMRERTLAEEFVEASERARVVVFPEDTRFFASLHLLSASERATLEATLAGGVHSIESARTPARSGVRDVIAVREGRRVVLESEKSYLVPFGEYIPLSVRIVLGVLGLGENLERLEESRASYRPGAFEPRERIVEISGTRFGITVCSETFSPSMYRAIGEAGADVFVNLASHSWIQDGRPLLFNQLLAMAQVHAVAAGIPYLQASAGAPTVVIIPKR